MALEGIATLPQAPGNAPQTVSTRDALDASKQALAQSSPESLQQYDQVMNDLVNQIDITPEEIDMMLQVLDYILQNEANYPEIRQKLIASNQVDEEDLPPEFDRGYFITLVNVLHEKQDRMGPTAQPQGFAKGGLAAAAESLRRKGRGGDTILAHINPQEAALLKSRGGKGTINPKTGLPEFGFFSKVWKAVTAPVKAVASSTVGRVVMTVALASVLGPAGLGLSSALAGGLAAAGTTLAAGGSLKDALISGAMGGITMGLTPSVSAYMPGAAGSFLNTALSAGAIGTAGGMLRGQSLSQALKSGALAGVTAGGIGALSNQMTPQEPAPVNNLSTNATIDADGNVVSGPATTADVSATNIAKESGALTGNVSQETSPFGIKAGPSQGIQSLNQLSAPTLPNAASPAAPTGPASFMTRAGEFYNNPSLSSFGEMIMPSDATPAQLQNSDAFKAARASGASYTEAMNAAKSSVNPGMMAKYGPTVALGLGATALAGGFKAKPATPPGLTNPNITGETLIKQDPNKYIVQGMPGVRYNPQGGIDYTGTGNVYQPSFEPTRTVTTPTYGLSNNVSPVYQPPGTSATQMPTGVQQPFNVAGMYDFMNYNPYAPQRQYAMGGPVMQAPEFMPGSSVAMYRQGGISQFPRKMGHISGPGTGTSDDIPAMLSDGEFVITAKAVKGIGNGSRREGAKKLYRMMHAMEKKAGGSI